MSLASKVGSFALNAVTGNQVITGVGLLPKALLFFTSGQTVDGSVSGLDYCQGLATSASNRVALAGFDGLGAAINAVDYQSTSACIIGINALGNPTLIVDIVSMDSDGFTLNISTSDGVARIVNFIALGGADLTNATIKQWTTATATGNQAITGVGFQPDCLFNIGSLNSTAPPGGRSIIFHDIGFGTSSSNRANTSWKSGFGGNEVAESMQSTSTFIRSSNVTLFYAADLVSLDSDGFTVNWSTANGTARYQFALCLKGGRYKVGSFNQPTGTGAQAITGLGFKPTGIYFQSFDNVSSSSILTQNRISMGATSGSGARFSWWEGDQNGASLSVNNMNLDRTNVIKMLTEGTPTLNSAADITSLDNDGFTVNWGTADSTQREVIYLAWGDLASSSPSASPSPSSSVSASPSRSPSASVSASPSSSQSPSSSVSSSPSASVSASPSPSPSSSISLSPSLSPSASNSPSPSSSVSLSPSVSISSSVSPSPSSSISSSPSPSIAIGGIGSLTSLLMGV